MGKPKKNKSAVVTTNVVAGEKSKSKVKAKFIKVKSVVNNSTLDKDIKEASTVKGRPKGETYNHVLWLTDGLYITCDSRQFIVRKVNNKTDKKGNKLPDLSLMYAQTLQQILKIAANKAIHVPSNVMELAKLQAHICSIIEARIPADIKPKDLFTGLEDIDE